MDLFTLKSAEDADSKPLELPELKLLAEIRDLPHWPALQRALMRYEARAYAVIAAPESSIEHIREAQGRLNMARQLADLLADDAPAAYEKRREPDEPDAQDDPD